MEIITKLSVSKLLLNFVFLVSLVLSTSQVVKNIDKTILAADFRAYYTAGKIVKDYGVTNLYNYELQNKIQQQLIQNNYKTILFINTPVAALLFLPLAFFEFSTAFTIFLLINSCLIASAVYIFCSRMKIDLHKTAILALYFPITSALYHNQLTSLILLIYVLLIVSLQKNTTLAAVFAALLALKPQHLLIAPFIFLFLKNKEEKKKFLLGFILSVIFFSLVNFLSYGFNAHRDYVDFLKSREISIVQQEKYEGVNIHSLALLLDANMGISNATILLTFLQGILLLLTAVLVIRSKNYTDTLSGIIILVLTLNIHTKYVDTLILMIPLLLAIQKIDPTKKETYKYLLISLILLTRQIFKIFIPYSFIVETIALMLCGFWLLASKKEDALKVSGQQNI